jgi:DNA-binding NarL/FixJ family response regulator
MTSRYPARLLIADDHAMVRRGLRMVLDAEPDLRVVAEAGDGAEAVRLAREVELDLAVLDVSMPRLTRLQATAELARERPELRVLMLSMHDNTSTCSRRSRRARPATSLSRRPTATSSRHAARRCAASRSSTRRRSRR